MSIPDRRIENPFENRPVEAGALLSEPCHRHTEPHENRTGGGGIIKKDAVMQKNYNSMLI